MFQYSTPEIILPIGKEEAKCIYDGDLDNNCPGPNRVNELKIWWKPKGVYKSFDCFCQDCYWKNKLTAPTGKFYTKDELEPCYIKGLLCNCDGESRKDYFPLEIIKDFKLAVSVANKKGEFTVINEYIKIINLSFSDSLKEFEGKNINTRIIIPNKNKRLSIVFEYTKEELSKYNYISHKLIDMKIIYAGDFKKPKTSPTIKKGKFFSYVKDEDIIQSKYANMSYENAKKLYLENTKINYNNENIEGVYGLAYEPPEYNIDFDLDDQNVLYYNFQLMIILAKTGEEMNFKEFLTMDVHIVPEDQIDKITAFLKTKTDKKIEKEISEIVL